MWKRKNYLKKLNRTPANPNPIEIITFLDRHGLAILFEVYARGHIHTQVATRNVQLTFMGGYLNYMNVLFVAIVWQKQIVFYLLIGQLAMPNCLQWYQQKNIEKT